MSGSNGDYGFYFILVVIILAAGLLTKNKYQVSRCGKNGAIVIDTATGEAWETETYGVDDGNKKTVLKPISYSYFQRDYFRYTPNDVRNCKNIGWWEKLTNESYKKREQNMSGL